MEVLPTLQRYGYVNTRSSAGKPVCMSFRPDQVLAMRCWVNGNGNPSYTYVIRPDGKLVLDGTIVLYSVDDYGAENNLGKVTVTRVRRKADLFAGWL